MQTVVNIATRECQGVARHPTDTVTARNTRAHAGLRLHAALIPERTESLGEISYGRHETHRLACPRLRHQKPTGSKRNTTAAGPSRHLQTLARQEHERASVTPDTGGMPLETAATGLGRPGIGGKEDASVVPWDIVESDEDVILNRRLRQFSLRQSH